MSGAKKRISQLSREKRGAKKEKAVAQDTEPDPSVSLADIHKVTKGILLAAFNNNARGAWVPGDVITYSQVQWGGSDPTAVALLNNNFLSV